jgi:hypothetical protein
MADDKTLNSVIHAAFRRDLARFDGALASCPDGSQSRADALGAAWDNLATQLRHHHEDEEALFWPALLRLGVDQALVTELDGEHARMLTALDAADASMRSFRSDPSGRNASVARGVIGELRAVLVEHLDHEERDLEPAAATHRKAPEIKAAQLAVRKSRKGEAGTFFAWLADGADDETRSLLRQEVPPPVLFMLTRVGGRDYRRRIATTWT